MKSRYILLCCIVLAQSFLYTACNTTTDASSSPNQVEINSEGAPNIADWRGTYAGVLPCADCEGIETQITVTEENIVMTRKYLGKTDQVFKDQDRLKYRGDKHMIIAVTLKEMNAFFIGKNYLEMADTNGDPLPDDVAPRYRLNRL